MGYRRNRPKWRRGGRDTFPLRVATLLGGLGIAFVAAVIWAASGGSGSEPVRAAGSDERTEETAERLAERPETADDRGAAAQNGEEQNRVQAGTARRSPEVAGADVAGLQEENTDAPPRASDDPPRPASARSVMTPVAARVSPPRPLRPADTTAAGHAGLAEALLAAGDTAAAIAAYNAFLARNTDPALERAAIARLRRIGGAQR